MACVVDATREPPVLKCTVCGGTDPFSLPMTVSQMSAVVKVFQDKHAMCPVREELKNAPKWEDVKP
jgi:hypothetical protein